MLSNAGPTAGTILVNGALGLAVGRRTDVGSQAGAGWRAIGVATLCVRTAWRWKARIAQRLTFNDRWRCQRAARKRITDVAGQAYANRRMIVHTADGLLAARCLGARINAFAIDARLGERAFTAGEALGPARGRRSDVGWQTGADRLLVDLATLRVRAAW